MRIVIKHDLPKDNAVECSKNIINNLREEHGDKISSVSQTWNQNKSDFSFSMKGLSVKGNIEVTNNEVIISGKLPFAAMMFKGIIENTIKKNAVKMLNDCKK